jgi:hypothetical protein
LRAFGCRFFRNAMGNTSTEIVNNTGPRLRDAISWSCIIAHNEETGPLEGALRAEGFQSSTQRRQVSAQEQDYSSSIRCLLNHKQAWERASKITGLSLIVEADFVPCRGFGNFPLPIPAKQVNRSAAWLYLCAGQLVKKVERQFLLGFSTSTVAYVLSPAAAERLLEFGEEMVSGLDLQKWSAWDSHIWWVLNQKEIPMFVAFRNYGEHGGFMNPQHRQDGRKPIPHRAECLMGPLHFLPFYACGHKGGFIRIRLFHKLKALAKFAWGRTVTRESLHRLHSNQERIDLIITGLRRLLSPY